MPFCEYKLLLIIENEIIIYKRLNEYVELDLEVVVISIFTWSCR